MNRFVALAGLLISPVLTVGCIVVEDDPPRHFHGSDTTTGSGGTTTAPPPPASSTDTPPSPAPMLAVVDTDQTMTADPGQGVGVFIEYGAGGNWHIWWTCDTAKTNQSCDYSVAATAAQGTIASVDASALQGGTVANPTPSRVEARITTTNQTHGLSFKTDPGVVVTVEASIGGVQDGSFLFFVQDGKVNGGFTGKVTNPLQVQGKTP